MVDGYKRSNVISMNTGYPCQACQNQYFIVSASLYPMERVLVFYRHDLALKGWREYICHVSDTRNKARLLFENPCQDLLDLILAENSKSGTDIHITVNLKGAANRVVLNFQDGELFYDEPDTGRSLSSPTSKRP
jgi:hypothetical protein